jgi:hypothetical protein
LSLRHRSPPRRNELVSTTEPTPVAFAASGSRQDRRGALRACR